MNILYLKKKCLPIIIPTEDKNFALGIQPNKVFKKCNSISELGIGQPYHMYIVSLEEIKEGDSGYFVSCDFEDFFVCRCLSVTTEDLGHIYKKIIATTDSSLEGLPMIEDTFIQHFVDSNGNIDEIFVEYKRDVGLVNGYKNQPENIIGFVAKYEQNGEISPKINDDNTISIWNYDKFY